MEKNNGRTLFPQNQDDVNVEAGMTLKRDNMPNSLYKYKFFDDNGNSLGILETDRIKLSIPEGFNDPFIVLLLYQQKKLGMNTCVKHYQILMNVYHQNKDCLMKKLMK